jgi:hypothetical protein
MEKTESRDPMAHTANIKKKFEGLIQHLREDISKVDDAQAKALFEVSAEVLGGLHKAFTDFESKDEEAWRRG